MKRFGTILLTMTMCLGLLACGKQEVAPEVEEAIEYVNGAEKEIEEEKEEEKEDAAKEASSEEDKATDAASEETSMAEEKTGDAAAEASSDSAANEESISQEENAPAQAPAESVQETAAEVKYASKKNHPDYGRMLFTGDSRTVDMFSEPADEIRGEVHDNIPVYCKDGCKYEYMVDAINEYGVDNFDTLVTWMGCNNFGDFSQYGPYYDSLLAQGKTIVACTVGPTVDECLLIDVDYLYYPNANQIKYNNSLLEWAKGKDNVYIIDLYNYINNSQTITVDPTDGIHYLPKPNTELWGHILGYLK